MKSAQEKFVISVQLFGRDFYISTILIPEVGVSELRKTFMYKK
jgi:hypothetical protein